MDEKIFSIWLIGLVIVSLGIGQVVSFYSVKWVRKSNWVNFDDPDKDRKSKIPGWFVGSLERLFFTILVAFDISGTAVAMMLWIALKMARNLDFLKTGEKKEDDFGRRMFVFSGLLGSMISMFFALIGGLIIRSYMGY